MKLYYHCLNRSRFLKLLKRDFSVVFFPLVLSLDESDLHSPSLQRTDVDVGSFGLSFVVSL